MENREKHPVTLYKMGDVVVNPTVVALNKLSWFDNFEARNRLGCIFSTSAFIRKKRTTV